MIVLFDVGNTNTHLGLANARRVIRSVDIPTAAWFSGKAGALIRRFAGSASIDGAAVCSVVPRATARVRRTVRKFWKVNTFKLTAGSLLCVGIDYPRPETIGPDRLANAVAARHHF